MYNRLSSNSQKALQKVALNIESVKPAAKFLYNYGVPIGSGVGVGLYANHEGASPALSAAIGAGAGSLSSPGRYRQIFNLMREGAKTGKDPFTIGSRELYKDLAIKVGIPAAVGVGEASYKHYPPILAQIDQATANVANISASAANSAPDLLKNLNRTAGGLGDFWDQEQGTSAKGFEELGRIVKEMETTSKDMRQNMATVAEGVKNVGNAGKSVSTLADNISNAGSKAVGWLDRNKLPIGAGVAGTAVGALLLRKLLADKKKREENNL